METERYAPVGKIWICTRCGKVAKDKYGFEGMHSRGWDASCMINATLNDYPPEIEELKKNNPLPKNRKE